LLVRPEVAAVRGAGYCIFFAKNVRVRPSIEGALSRRLPRKRDQNAKWKVQNCGSHPGGPGRRCSDVRSLTTRYEAGGERFCQAKPICVGFRSIAGDSGRFRRLGESGRRHGRLLARGTQSQIPQLYIFNPRAEPVRAGVISLKKRSQFPAFVGSKRGLMAKT
jgi:hypothetical protein